jgi:citrate lyase alpha subunit
LWSRRAAQPHSDGGEARHHAPHAGESIDVLVTDHGIAVNPARPEIRERLLEAGLKVVDISALYERAIS